MSAVNALDDQSGSRNGFGEPQCVWNSPKELVGRQGLEPWTR
jgi:hypothetical protein